MLAGSAQAAIIYNEAVDGSVPNAGTANLGILAPGANTIVGTLAGGILPGFVVPNVGDTYVFQVAPGTRLVSITLDSLTFPSPQDAAFGMRIIFDSEFRMLSSDTFGLELLPLFGSDAVGPGSYRLRFQTRDVRRARTPWPYQATFNVVSDEVPEPGSLSLLLLGAGALFAVRRKRQSA